MLYLATFLLRASFGAMMLLGPLYMYDIELEIWKIGVALGAYNVGQMLTVTYWGKLSDRAGVRKPFLILGSMLAAGSFMIFPLYQDFLMLTFANFLQGIGAAATIGPSLAMVTELSSDENRGRQMGLFETATYAGLAVGFLAGGFLWEMQIDGHKFGSHTFYAFAFVLIGAAIVFMIRMKELDPRMRRPDSQLTPVAYRILNERTFYFLAVAIALFGMVFLFIVQKWGFYEFFSVKSYANAAVQPDSWLTVLLVVAGMIASIICAVLISVGRRRWGMKMGKKRRRGVSSWRVLKNPKFQVLLPPWFAIMTIIGTLTTYGPIMLRGGEEATESSNGGEGMNMAEIGVVFVLAMVLLGITQVGFGKMTDRVGRLKLMVAGLLGGAISLTLGSLFLENWISKTMDNPVSIIAICMLGASAMTATAFGPAALAALGDASEAGQHGESAGLYSLIQGLGDMLGAVVGGVIFQFGGAIGITGTMAAVAAVAAVWMIVIPRLPKYIGKIR